mmetsp:Transcript_23544/g.72928  ORF Transcript_23544/g.72928 Transcript_23544/m.72928 type:complete len:345 (-) Transcript_23544:159-1193(-)
MVFQTRRTVFVSLAVMSASPLAHSEIASRSPRCALIRDMTRPGFSQSQIATLPATWSGYATIGFVSTLVASIGIRRSRSDAAVVAPSSSALGSVAAPRPAAPLGTPEALSIMLVSAALDMRTTEALPSGATAAQPTAGSSKSFLPPKSWIVTNVCDRAMTRRFCSTTRATGPNSVMRCCSYSPLNRSTRFGGWHGDSPPPTTASTLVSYSRATRPTPAAGVAERGAACATAGLGEPDCCASSTSKKSELVVGRCASDARWRWFSRRIRRGASAGSRESAAAPLSSLPAGAKSEYTSAPRLWATAKRDPLLLKVIECTVGGASTTSKPASSQSPSSLDDMAFPRF